MKIVLDNNILFSIMNHFSAASYLFASIKSEFFAPNIILFELDKYKEECLSKSNISEQEFEIRLNEVKSSINFINSSYYKNFLLTAINNLEDPKDSPYLALALFLNASIWSNDPHFKKQSSVKVYTTEDLLNLFLKGEI